MVMLFVFETRLILPVISSSHQSSVLLVALYIQQQFGTSAQPAVINRVIPGADSPSGSDMIILV